MNLRALGWIPPDPVGSCLLSGFVPCDLEKRGNLREFYEGWCGHPQCDGGGTNVEYSVDKQREVHVESVPDDRHWMPGILMATVADERGAWAHAQREQTG